MVRNAKTDELRIAQLHLMQTLEVSLFGIREGLLRTSNRGRTYSIDKAVGLGINLANARLGCFGRDEKDNLQPVLLRRGLIFCDELVERKVGNDKAVNAYCLTLLTKVFKTKVKNRIELAH